MEASKEVIRKEDYIKLKEEYNTLLKKYILYFIRTSFEDDCLDNVRFNWVSDSVIEVNDYFMNIDTIRYIVDNNIPFEEWEVWYEYCLRLGAINENIKTPTLEEWIDGSKNVKSLLEIERLEKLKQDVDNAKKALYDEIERLKPF